MRIDVVVPAFNEEDRIDRMLRSYRAAIVDPAARFVVALDSCTDATAEVVAGHTEVDRRVELHSFPKLGKGGVIMEALRRCDAPVVGFVDADGATPPSEFMRLAAAIGPADVAIATRSHPSSVLPARRLRRRVAASWGFSALVRAMFGIRFHDTQCGAKVVSRRAVDEMLPLLSSRDFLFDVDLLVTAQRLGLEVVEVPTVWLDQPGSHISAAADARRMALSSLRLWIHHRVLPVPPRLVTGERG